MLSNDVGSEDTNALVREGADARRKAFRFELGFAFLEYGAF